MMKVLCSAKTFTSAPLSFTHMSQLHFCIDIFSALLYFVEQHDFNLVSKLWSPLVSRDI